MDLQNFDSWQYYPLGNIHDSNPIEDSLAIRKSQSLGAVLNLIGVRLSRETGSYTTGTGRDAGDRTLSRHRGAPPSTYSDTYVRGSIALPYGYGDTIFLLRRSIRACEGRHIIRCNGVPG